MVVPAKLSSGATVSVVLHCLLAGGVGWTVYADYCKHIGVATCIFLLLALLVGQAAYLGSEYWLATWAYR